MTDFERLIDLYSIKIINGLPEWNYFGADTDAQVQKQKNCFRQKIDGLKYKNIPDEETLIRCMDYVIAQYVPDEHVQIRIKGEDKRAAAELISKDSALTYKIPPTENNNLINSDEKFSELKKFVLKASQCDETANILVATQNVDTRKVGIVAIDSFMIEMGSEQTRNEVEKIADYVLEQSKQWDDIIFDFRGNGGGDATIIKEIGERLSAKKLQYADKIEIINKDLDEITGAPDFYPQKSGDVTFKGNVFVLQDGGNASAAEGAIWMLRQMNNCKTVGENTHGAFAGGDVKRHDMGNAVLQLGNTYRERILPNGEKVKEGKGIPADVKTKSSEAYAQTINFIKNDNKVAQQIALFKKQNRSL